MKKTKLLLLVIFLFGIITCAFTQSSSTNGYWLPNKGTIRVFFVFAEVTGDPSDIGSTPNWSQGQMPTNADDYFDQTFTNEQSIHGYFSKYFYETSFGNLIVLGDYYPNLVQLSYNGNWRSDNEVVNYLNNLLGSDIITAHGYSINSDAFDTWKKPTGYGQVKQNISDNYIDYMIIIWRVNKLEKFGGGDGYATSISLKSKLGLMDRSRFRSQYSDPWTILRHEFVHSIYGSNLMHAGGAGHSQRTFMSDVGGYSILSSYNSISNCWNAYDRRRLDWKNPLNTDIISARKASDYSEIPTDFTYGQSFSDGNEFILRDFVTNGDAIRIKLPYLKSENSNTLDQWLWLENHQGVSSDFDHKNKGLYAYIQVGKDNLTSFGGDNDYLWPVTGFGNYDLSYEFLTTKSVHDLHIDTKLFENESSTFVAANKIIANSSKANPFTGYHLLMNGAFNFIEPNIVTINGTTYQYSNKILSSELILAESVERDGVLLPESDFNYYTYPVFGNVFDCFGVGRKIGIGYNPAATPVYSYYTDDAPSYPPQNSPQNYNNRKIYLNGISIEIMQQYSNGDIRVKIRWDDFDVTNDVRWCGDIVLNEQVHLLSGKTIKLDQGLTPQKPVNPITFNGVNVFADPTVFTCKNNSTVTCENNSQFIVDNGSTLKLQTGSLFEVKNGAVLRIKNNSKLLIEQGGQLKVDDGGLVIIEGSSILEYNGGSINLLGNNSILEINGIIKIGDNATFTFTGNGYIDFKTPWIGTNSILCGTNSQFKLSGTSSDHLVLKISGYGMPWPQDNLSRFTIYIW